MRGGWRASHEAFCTPEFFVKHTDVYQLEYLRKEIQNGKSFFLLLAPGPVGVVSVHGPLLEHLYVLPQMQGRGFGTRLRALRWGRARMCCGCWTTTAGPSAGTKAGALPLPDARNGCRLR